MVAPTRRSLLRISGSLLATGFLAGCIGDSSPGEEAESSGTTTDEPTPTATDEPTPTATDEPTPTTTESTESPTDTVTAENIGNRSDEGTDTGFFQIESQYTEPQKIIVVNHQGIVRTRDIEYRDSVKGEATSAGTPVEETITTSSAETVTISDSATQATEDDSNTSSSGVIRVWNDSDDARQVALTMMVTNRPADPFDQETYSGSPKNPILEEIYSVNPDAFISVDLLEPADYEISVGIGQQTTETIEFTVDNCNSQTRFIGLMADGSIKSGGVSTTMLCEEVNPINTSSDNTSD